ncbi:MAG: hypothetical protein OXE87_18140 [Chloroflexi bacterium]|nr:hypothetical protein [Chloroflexota bacterium]
MMGELATKMAELVPATEHLATDAIEYADRFTALAMAGSQDIPNELAVTRSCASTIINELTQLQGGSTEFALLWMDIAHNLSCIYTAVAIFDKPTNPIAIESGLCGTHIRSLMAAAIQS